MFLFKVNVSYSIISISLTCEASALVVLLKRRAGLWRQVCSHGNVKSSVSATGVFTWEREALCSSDGCVHMGTRSAVFQRRVCSLCSSDGCVHMGTRSALFQRRVCSHENTKRPASATGVFTWEHEELCFSDRCVHIGTCITLF